MGPSFRTKDRVRDAMTEATSDLSPKAGSHEAMADPVVHTFGSALRHLARLCILAPRVGKVCAAGCNELHRWSESTPVYRLEFD